AASKEEKGRQQKSRVMTYRGIEAPESIDLYRYQNGEITIRRRRAKFSGTGPPWSSHKTGTRQEDKARAFLASWLKREKITDVDAAKVPFILSKPQPGTALAVIPSNGKDDMTEAERRASQNGYRPPASHRKKNGKGGGEESLRDIVGIIAANLNSLAVAIRLLQDRIGNTTSE